MVTKEQEYPDQYPTGYHGVICNVHGRQGLSPREYKRQLRRAGIRWACPITGCKEVYAEWDESRYEEKIRLTLS